MADMQPAREALTAGVRLVNLTEHEIVLDTQPTNASGEDPGGSALSAPLRVPRAGEFARVDDPGG